jgi:hypothetical protein
MATKDKFRQCYTRSKADAKRRGIDFLFTFEEWKQWWIDTGKWELRGKTRGSFQMCRFNDQGPYAVDNVYCDTVEANSALPHAGKERPADWRLKLQQSLAGREKDLCHRQSLAATKLGKRYSTPCGVYATSKECQEATGVKAATVMWRCKNNWNGWGYAPLESSTIA